MNNNVIAKIETYTWMLNGLLASYGRYADEAGINLSDRESEFCIEYYKIMEEEKKLDFTVQKRNWNSVENLYIWQKGN